MPENVKVSVVITTYNRCNLVKRALRSVLQQTYRNFEVIVVDDGSTDGTEDKILKFEDEKVKVISHSKNKGSSAARNTGIGNSEGEFVFFLDSDDYWLPHKLEEQINYINESEKEVEIIYSGVIINDGKDIRTVSPKDTCSEYNALLSKNTLGQIASSIGIKKRLLESVDGFDESLPSAVDADLWIRLSRVAKFEYVNNFLAVKDDTAQARLGTDYDSKIKATKIMYDKYKREMGELQKRKRKARMHRIKGQKYYSNNKSKLAFVEQLIAISKWPFYERSWKELAKTMTALLRRK